MTHRILIPAFGLLFSGCIVEGQTDAQTFTFDEPITDIRADVNAGDLFITGGDVAAAEVFREIEWSGDEPRAVVWVDNGVLNIELECRSGQLICSADHTVTVPADVAASLVTGAGDVSLEGLNGVIDIDTGAGDIDGRGLKSPDIIAVTGSGSVDLGIVDVVNRVELDSGAGDVDLTVPAGDYRVDASSGAGDVDINNINRDSQADSVIIISSGAGDISIVGQ
ncbi:MAG: DUF4097 family beta strand repeat-containing protein [Myxococcota bacterium]